MRKDSLKVFQVKLQNLPVETKQIVSSPALYVLDPSEKLDKHHWKCPFPLNSHVISVDVSSEKNSSCHNKLQN